MPITKLTPENNYAYLQDRLKELEQVVPEAFVDGKVNWDTLREALGESLEDEGKGELLWPELAGQTRSTQTRCNPQPRHARSCNG